MHSTPNKLPIAVSSRMNRVFFTSEERKNILRRMKNMHIISDHQTKDFRPSHVRVQLLNTVFANKKRLDCFSDSLRDKERNESKLHQDAQKDTTEVSIELENECSPCNEPEYMNSVEWSDEETQSRSPCASQCAGSYPLITSHGQRVPDLCFEGIAPLNN